MSALTSLMEAAVGPPERPWPVSQVRRQLWRQGLLTSTIRSPMSAQRTAWARARYGSGGTNKPARRRRRPIRVSLALLRLWRRRWRQTVRHWSGPRFAFAC